MKLSYEEIRRIHRLEKNTSKLVSLEPDFFNQLHDFLAREKAAYQQSVNDLSLDKGRDFANLRKMVQEIFQIREKKLLSKALIASRTSETGDEGLAVQEKRTFQIVLDALAEHEKLLEGFFNGETVSARAAGRSLETLSVETLQDVPAFVGTDLKEYGPYKKGQSIQLPNEIAKLLETRKLVEAKA